MKSYVCVLSTDNYLEGLLLLNKNLKLLNSKYDLLCVINENISEDVIKKIEFFGIKYIICKSIKFDNVNFSNPYWIYTFDKLNIFSLVEYEKLVFLDLDLLLVENIDDLFDYEPLSLPKNSPFNEDEFCSGIMVLKPNLDDFEKLKDLTVIRNNKGEKISDQDVINEYFYGKINTIPKEYNVCKAVVSDKFLAHDYLFDCFDSKNLMVTWVRTDRPKIIHYIGPVKPFMIDSFYNDCYSFLYFYYLNFVRKDLCNYEFYSKSPLISIIVPIYNKEKYLKKTLDSIINQKYKNLEIILVDDCSTDGSYEICKEYLEKDSRIKLLRNEKNSGVSKTRNMGLDNASGEYIGFVDADDYIEESMYDVLLKDMFEYDLDFVQCGISLSDDQVRTTYYDIVFYDNADLILYNYLTENVFSDVVFDKLFKKDIIGDIRFREDLLIHEDTEFISNVVARSNKAATVGYVLYHYAYKKGDSLTGSYDFNKEKNFLEVFDRIESFIINNYAVYISNFNKFRFDKICWFLNNINSNFDNYIFEKDDILSFISKVENLISSFEFNENDSIMTTVSNINNLMEQITEKVNLK